MGFEFLCRVRKTSIMLGIFLALVITTYSGTSTGGAWIVGFVWSLINIHLIGELVRNVFTKEKKNRSKITLCFAAKFPLLYSLGFLALNSAIFPALGLLAGFVWPFFVMTMKALGRTLLGLDEPRAVYLDENGSLSAKF